MPHVETVEVDLSTRGVQLPRSSVGMVIAQPYLTLSQTEPYRCKDQAKPQQLDAIAATLEVARTVPHGAPRTHFTLFPEYSIPGLEGVDLVGNTLDAPEWPKETIIIGGTDGLSREDFVTLAAAPNTNLDTTHNNPKSIMDGEWINCGITWVKGTDGTVERWLQPKLCPAWPEQNVTCNNMFRGNSVFVFKGQFASGTQYRFFSLVCFDWIAPGGGQKPWRAVVKALSRQADELQAELSLSWLFVIQNNQRPSAESFLTEVNAFFDQTVVENVRRDRACLVFANSAGKHGPGRIERHGNTSLLFAGQTLFTDPECHPTFCNGGPRFRQHELLAGHKDLLFREGGACIHSFQQVNPGSLTAGAPGKTIALSNPGVHSFGGPADPRTPATPVPASVKWLNDELDGVPSLSNQYPEASLATEVDKVHHRAVDELRAIPGNSINRSVKLAAQDSKAQNADQWDCVEREAVCHLINTLNIVGLSSEQCVVADRSVHATLTIKERSMDLVVIRGRTHDLCLKHYKKMLPMGRNLVLLVSRDPDNNPWLERFGSFLQPPITQQVSERNITDPGSEVRQLGYRELLDIFQTSDTVAEAKEQLSVKLDE